MIKFNIKNIFSVLLLTLWNPIHSHLWKPTNSTEVNHMSMNSQLKLICNYSKCHDLNFVILRYFNISVSDFSKNLDSLAGSFNTLALRQLIKNSILKFMGMTIQQLMELVSGYIRMKDLGNVHLLNFKVNSSKVNQIINVGEGLYSL